MQFHEQMLKHLHKSGMTASNREFQHNFLLVHQLQADARLRDSIIARIYRMNLPWKIKKSFYLFIFWILLKMHIFLLNFLYFHENNMVNCRPFQTTLAIWQQITGKIFLNEHTHHNQLNDDHIF